MLVMKFGGASVKDAASVRNVAEIIGRYQDQSCLVVVSAMGKMTNALEQLARYARAGEQSKAMEQFQHIVLFHAGIVQDLFPENAGKVIDQINPFFEEIERIMEGILFLEEFSDRIYDRVVSYGELLSTRIVSAYIHEKTGACEWIDARKILQTDASHKRASVIWSLTEQNIQQEIKPKMQTGKVLITQGFIGSTTRGYTTTLGREGSDFTAAIFAWGLEAESVTVWKDVPGILNADPKLRPDAVKLDALSYEEAVEMTFYGAKVIHTKTIKPLFEKGIPLYVRSFVNPEGEGTCISQQASDGSIPSYIIQDKQSLIRISPRNLSFMNEGLMREIFIDLAKAGLNAHLVQNSAVSLLLCTDHRPKELRAFESMLIDTFFVHIEEDVSLQTILNFREEDLQLASKALMTQQHGKRFHAVVG